MCKIGREIAWSEMQETIEDEWKTETREKDEKREGKEEAEEKSENDFINHN